MCQWELSRPTCSLLIFLAVELESSNLLWKIGHPSLFIQVARVQARLQNEYLVTTAARRVLCMWRMEKPSMMIDDWRLEAY